MADAQQTIIPIEKREVDFYGDMLIGVLIQKANDLEPEIYIPVRPICGYLGLAWTGQLQRMKRDEVLNEALAFVRITRTNSATGSSRGDPDVQCLPLRLLPGWLFGISADRVKPEVREKIIRYRRECYQILWNAFRHDIMSPVEVTPARTGQSGAQIAYEIATAVQHLAQQQMEQEQRLAAIEDSQQRARSWARSVNTRLNSLEIQLTPAANISQEQAGDLALAVKNVGNALERQGDGKGNGYQRVYGELYRRYSISSYKSLPREKFDEVMTWLKQWFDDISASAAL
jgi:hypothetical protein